MYLLNGQEREAVVGAVGALVGATSVGVNLKKLAGWTVWLVKEREGDPVESNGCGCGWRAYAHALA
jgi:hypothetical protein